MSLESVNECKNVHHVFVFIDRAVTLSGRSFPFPAMHLSFHLTRDLCFTADAGEIVKPFGANLCFVTLSCMN